MPVDPSQFRHLVSGQSQGFAATAARGTLRGLSWPYSAVIKLRNTAYDSGWKKIHTVSVPVISVGNITTGGTGKTPIVAALVRQLQNDGHSPGIVSRGYRANETGTNDEKRVLECLCPDVPHYQGADRVAVAEELIRDHSVSAIVLDDGFQHRRIHRDMNVVLIDATDPFGSGHLLPRGFLREPISSLHRADMVLVTRSDQADETALKNIESTIGRNIRTDVSVVRVTFQPSTIATREDSQPADNLANRKVFVATAIGNPDAFVTSLKSLGAKITGQLFFPDHHHFSSADLAEIEQRQIATDSQWVVTTLKDYVKLEQLSPETAFRFLNIEADFDQPLALSTFVAAGH